MWLEPGWLTENDSGTYLIFFRLPGLEWGVPATISSLSTPVLCKIDRSGFLPASSAGTNSDATAEVAMTTGLAAAAIAACGEGADFCPLKTGLTDTSDLRTERCSTSFLNESSRMLLCPSTDFLPYNIKQLCIKHIYSWPSYSIHSHVIILLGRIASRVSGLLSHPK